MLHYKQIRPLGIAGYICAQVRGDSGLVMRRLSRVEVVLVYEFIAPQSCLQVDVSAGQTCNVTHGCATCVCPP